jgi:hypothetical protein
MKAKMKDMEIKTEIKISEEELTNLIKEHYQIDGNIHFIIKEESYRSAYIYEGDVYSTRYVFDGVKITNIEQK